MNKIRIYPNEVSLIRLTHYMKKVNPEKTVQDVKTICEQLRARNAPMVIEASDDLNNATVLDVHQYAIFLSEEESEEYWYYDPRLMIYHKPEKQVEETHQQRIQREWNTDYNKAIKHKDSDAAMRALTLLEQNPWLMCASAS